MRTISTTSNPAYLVHIANHLIQFGNTEDIQLLLTNVIEKTELNWRLRFYIANALFCKGIGIRQSEKVIRKIDIEQCLSQWDTDSCCLSPSVQLNYATVVAMGKGMESAIPLIQKIYSTNPGIQNAFAQVAWHRYITEDTAYDKVIPYFEKDENEGKLCGVWRCNYAQALMFVGREAEAKEIIEDTYTKENSLSGGFAKCGLKYLLFFNDLEKAIPWFERELSVGQLSNAHLINYTSILAVNGFIDEATSLAQRIQQENPHVNGYAYLAWYGYIIRCFDPEKALDIYKRGKRTNIIDYQSLNFLFGILTYMGKRDEVRQQIEDTYKYSQNINFCYMFHGFCDYLYNRDIEYLYSMVQTDEKLGRLNYYFLKYIFSAIQNECGDTENFKDYVCKTNQRSTLTEQFARGWIKRIGYHENDLISKFIPQL